MTFITTTTPPREADEGNCCRELGKTTRSGKEPGTAKVGKRDGLLSTATAECLKVDVLGGFVRPSLSGELSLRQTLAEYEGKRKT